MGNFIKCRRLGLATISVNDNMAQWGLSKHQHEYLPKAETGDRWRPTPAHGASFHGVRQMAQQHITSCTNKTVFVVFLFQTSGVILPLTFGHKSLFNYRNRYLTNYREEIRKILPYFLINSPFPSTIVTWTRGYLLFSLLWLNISLMSLRVIILRWLPILSCVVHERKDRTGR